MILRILLSLSLLCVPFAMQAQTYKQLAPDQSRIAFRYQQMGVTMDGGFNALRGRVAFDLAKPEQASVVLEVALSGIDTGYDEANEEAVKPEWFNAARFPFAQFESDEIKVSGEDGYNVSGRLSVKGKTVPVSFPVSFTQKGDEGVFEGGLKIKRGDFDIGEGSWSQFDIVANEVEVMFHIVVQP